MVRARIDDKKLKNLLYSGPFLTGDELVMPFKELFSSLIMLILPTALGMWVRWRWPKAEHFMKKIIVPFTLLTVLFIFTAGIYINLFIFLLMTPTMVLAGFTIAIAGYVFGASLAWVFGLPRGQIIAVAIETSFQNASIAFILLKISLPEPYGELAAVAPVAQVKTYRVSQKNWDPCLTGYNGHQKWPEDKSKLSFGLFPF